LVNSLVLGLETKTLHGSLELLGVDGSTSVGVEEVKSLPDLLDLLLGEAGPLIGLSRLTGRGTTGPGGAKMGREKGGGEFRRLV